MGESSKRSTRIDWFDGTIVEDTRAGTDFADEDQPGADTASKYTEKKPIGFKRLLDMSLLKPPVLTLEISHRPGFWNLFEQDDLKGDVIVLLMRILANVYKEIEPNDKSKIATLLKTRVLKSSFLDKLKKYLVDLPSVRVVEKKMNAQLWDDVEGFYILVLELCKGINRFGGNSTEYNDVLHELLEALEVSALGVREEHSERFSSDLFDGINSLKLDTVDEDDNWESFEIAEKPSNPDSFKILNIFPTREDIVTKSNAKIKPNIINGAYISVEHYLDLQFKLLREDCFGPLRDGILYPQVRVLRTYVSNNRVGHLVDIAYQERINNKLDKRYNKQLMFGSLLLFTSDRFDTILCATTIFLEPFVMVESEVFFEPYHQVLKPETKPPAYLTPETIYTILPPGKVDEIPFPVLDAHWPNAFGLDDSQLEAYKFALTREFAVIQGPPGTGKTFLGIKIASTILQNQSLEGTPLLVICYTNHALDQFLEGILKVTKSVIRLGSQSKSKALEAYNLNSVRAKVKCKYSYLYGSKRAELEKIYKEMTDLQSEIEKCEDSIICYKCVKPYLKIGDKSYELKYSDEDPILNWLYGLKDTNKLRQNGAERLEKELECFIVDDGKISTCFSEKIAANEIDSIKNILKCVSDCNSENLKNKETNQKLTNKVKSIEKKLDYFKMDKVDSLYTLSLEQRWQLYFNVVREMKNELLAKMDVLLKKHNTAHEELSEVSDLIDSEVMTTARVVGVTTTAAARRHQLVKKLSSPIVIVEEAAEVLEAHIVSLFERMIRNGIHARTLTTQRRMRRNFVELLVPAVYERLDSHAAVLAYQHVRGMKDNLYFYSHDEFEDSEFEWMIRNGIHARTLTTQRRMRRKFVELLVPAVYEILDIHAAVLAYQHGMEDSWSHKNTFEAKWCVALANYLRKMKYTPDEVTVLATFLHIRKHESAEIRQSNMECYKQETIISERDRKRHNAEL
ncbi:putative NFX1-type zinc finger-containing protein 1 [Operophtera brumata]|uniref:Putative NFX1-type zinc finger-containing protein 1 n=1 Tax=Operophtera brumata TaxID=104452 RepID=A0A0L7L283_OPEBR|nr:putative NFX1-type zinc finger-containing protein 1 [Operophtera brumata]